MNKPIVTVNDSERSCCAITDKKIFLITCIFVVVVSTVLMGLIIACIPRARTRDENTAREENTRKQHPVKKVNISGIYILEQQYNDNYRQYLLAMDIQASVVPLIISATETIIIKMLPPDESGINMKTTTNWVTREINFWFNREFELNYGGEAGSLINFCNRPYPNIVHCKSEEKQKGWRFEFDLIFSEVGMINRRSFITKNIEMKKIYRRQPFS